MIRIQPKDPKGIKIRLKQLRLEMGWSKTQTANKIGVPISTYANWEYGVRIPNQLNAMEIAKVFNTTLSYIFDGGTKAKKTKSKVTQIHLQDIIDNADIFYDNSHKISEDDRNLFVNFAKSIMAHYKNS